MTDAQAAAFTQLRRLAAPGRLRVVADAEGYPVIRGRLGDIEWHHAEGTHLAAYTAGRQDRLGRLLSLPGITRHQVGDTECRILFPVAMLPEVARVIRARTRQAGRPMTTAQAHALRQARISAGSPGADSTRREAP